MSKNLIIESCLMALLFIKQKPIFMKTKIILAVLLMGFVMKSHAQTPSFAPAVTYSVGAFPNGVVQADFTGDGKADIAVANGASRSITVLKNSGTGTFSFLGQISMTSSTLYTPKEIVSGDFDGDGDKDIVATLNGFLAILTNDGIGNFSVNYFPIGASNMSIAAGLFNNDTKPDLALVSPNSPAGQKLVVLISTSGPTTGIWFGPTNYAIGNFPNDVETADFNNDGKIDVVTGNSSSNNVSILFGDGAGFFSAASNYSTGTSINALTVADFNNDSFKDIVITQTGFFDAKLLLNNGFGAFPTASNLVTDPTGTSFPNDVRSADVNGDNNQDIIFKNNNNLLIYPGNGNGTFGSLATISGGVSSETLNRAIEGDFNNDNKIDFAVTMGSSVVSNGKVSVLINNGSFSPEPTTPASNISFLNLTNSSVRVQWTSGNGSGRIVVVKEASSVNQSPVDFTAYSPNTSFPLGQEIVPSSGNRVIYSGSGGFVDVTGLNTLTTYYFAIYEYNGLASLTNYRIVGAPTSSITTPPNIYVINPSNGAITNNITLTVNGSLGAASYTLELNTNPTFSGTSVIKTNTGLSTNFPEITFNTTYYVRVKTNLSPIWGVVTSFSTGSASSFAYVLNPVDGSTTTSNSITSNVVPGASSYTIEVNTSSTFSAISAITKTNASRTINFPELVYGTLYYVRVKTNLSATWGPTQSFTTGSVENYTYVTSPANGGTTSQYNITANSIAGATSYIIEINSSSLFDISTAIEKTSATRTISFPELTYNQLYYSRVKTNLSPNWGPTRIFTTNAPESFTYLINPSNGSIGIPVDVQLIPNAINGTSSYTITVSENADFSVPFFDQPGTGTPYSPYVFGLNYGTLYYVRIKTDLSINWGPTRSFTTVLDPNGLRIGPSEKISIYPNSFTNQLSFTVKDEKNQNVSASILDSQGVLVHKSSEYVTNDTNQIKELEHLHAGIYYLQLSFGNEKRTLRVIKTN